MSRVAVIGGGAAGLMACIAAAEKNDVILIEKNKKVGRKILITGKGRCNVTNFCDNETVISNMTKNPRFMYSAVNNYSPMDVYSFFEDSGVPLKVERGNRVFPVSDRAIDIADALYNCIRSENVKMINGRAVALITEYREDQLCVSGVKLENGDTVKCERVIIATGGLSYPLTGSTGDGYGLAKSVGHTVTKLMPSLVSLVTEDEDIYELAGLSLKNCSLNVFDVKSGENVYDDFGEMLFTHYGVSGPMILSASAHMRNMEKGRYMITVDLKPALEYDVLDKRILKDLDKYKNRDISNSLFDLLPRSIIPAVIRRSGIDPHKKSNSLTKNERHALADTIKGFKISVRDFRPVDEAIVTTGGIDVKEIDPKTMQSKLVRGLFFAGEIIDVDAYTGGFNLQIAFSTGRLAGENV